MCSILGGSNHTWKYDRAIQCMRHRGPDGIRVCPMEDFTLAFARLAIIDLSESGMQPMFSDDDQVGIVFNGEIYGYQKLRSELIRKGYQFRSRSDTEVVLNAYLEWGEQFIRRVDGMFGLAIYDKREKSIKLYRDRLGIKPLYYFFDGNHFGFASELKGILKMCDAISFEIDHTAVYDYLNYSYIPEPKTYYKNVYKLLPGHCLIYDLHRNDIIKNVSYWKLKVNESQGTQRKQDDLIEELRILMEESIKEQIAADVPVGTFLSGGVDSGIVTYEGHKIDPQIETFSIGFANSDYDESEYIYELAKQYQFRMNLKVFTRSEFKNHQMDIRRWFDEPFGDTSAYPTYMVSRLAKEKVSVVLTGDGGDEVFGGYWWQQLIRKKEEEHGPDNLLISAIYKRVRQNNTMDYFWMDELEYLFPLNKQQIVLNDKKLRKCLGIDKDYDKHWYFRKYYCKDLPPMTRVQFLDLKTYLPSDILTKVDRTSMAVSLETRVPMLSKKLVEFSFSLSEEDRCPGGEQKGLLKRAYQDVIGKRILYRTKMGFNMPYDYFNKQTSPQQYLLERIWQYNLGLGGSQERIFWNRA
ncbi:MAG: asparagine synthase (glutamine-hydrolyzing) [Lachnospiraceae bacterium]|jgi:asparagine synthase (glutamine-hydrolysing)|nr:asparagine synthase (glutamine-hydrolyzing) [Lachnospiraceae bacterium]